ncbi:MAG TPA: 7TM diverse intracellular signaling domain-containing protein, partial [Ohtaekwangia sp.]|nr:7TM diverse intracellular signaling domain-containing protein [Ohtaekwangia sp.]
HFKGGIREPLYFGKVSGIQSDYNLSITGTLIACLFLFSLSIIFLIYYFRHPRKNITAAYSMLCLCWAIRSMFSNLYPVTISLPDFDWDMLVRIEYFSLYLIMIFSVMLLNQLFQELGSAVFNSIMILVNLLFFLFTLVSEPAAFTRWLPLYLATAVLVIVYGLVIVFRALIHEKKGSWPLIGGMCMMILLTGYEIIAYKGLLGSNQFLSSIGFIVLFTCLTVGVLQYLGILKTDASGSELTYNDLYKKDK